MCSTSITTIFVCEKEISKLDSDFKVDIQHEKSESATHCLVRFLSKLFFKDGSGVPLFTKIYLKKHYGIFDVPILNF